MIRVVLFFGLVAAALIAYRAYNQPKQPRLAPEGTYFLSEYVSLKTPHGVVGFPAGEMVRQTRGRAPVGMIKVTDGNYVIDVAETQLTNDLDVASSIVAGERESQRLLGEEASKAQAFATKKQALIDASHAQNVAIYEARTRSASAVGNLVTPLNARPSYVGGGYFGGGYGGYGSYYSGGIVTNGVTSGRAVDPQQYVSPPKWSAPKK